MQALDTHASPPMSLPPVLEVARATPENEEPQEAQATATSVRARCGWPRWSEGREACRHEPAASGTEPMDPGE